MGDVLKNTVEEAVGDNRYLANQINVQFAVLIVFGFTLSVFSLMNHSFF